MVFIDGTEIQSGSTIDGAEIKEITIDGTVAWKAVLDEGLQVHYVFDENTTTDLSGNNNNATLNNVTFQSTGGYDGNGAMVTSASTSSYIDTNYVAGDGDMTILISARISNVSSTNQDIWQTATPQWQPGVWVTTSNMRNHFGDTHPDGLYTDSSISVNGSTNYIWGGRISGTSLNNILDGTILSDNGNSTFNRDVGSTNLLLGGSQYGESSVEILEFRLYNRALSDSEVSEATGEMR